MNRTMTAPVLEPVGEGKVALQSVNVKAEIENLLCEVTIKQAYSNLEEINIEAVYTFPLPLDAVLLDMTIKTRTKELKGVVIEKKEAEERYEDAVTDGDTAIMLEQVDPGLYTMNVGNLQPGETIEISITYAELFKWRDNSLRFFLPTTIAPRYGDPESIDVQPHQVPEHAQTNENPFSIALSIFGVLADASIESPSHTIVSDKQDRKTVVSLKKGQALMDRDFVLNLTMGTEEKSVAHVEPDGDGYIALASFYPRLPPVPDKAPRCVTIIVDCSGSMNGDSITQARKALYEILELLQPEDKFNVIRFGSSYERLFPSTVLAGAGNLKKAKNHLEVLEADMGGTEIMQAIAAAVEEKPSSEISKDVLLITDGEVWNWEKITAMAAKSGSRFFTVGVGSSVSEAFVQTLADTTGGACELVSPNEDMAEKIIRHFRRIYFPKAENVRIHWPCEPDITVPENISSVFDGDTLHVFGRFKERPSGDIEMWADLENGETFAQKLAIQNRAHSQTPTENPGTMARMAASYVIRTLEDSKEIAALGVEYQLMSRCTNYLAIDVKADGEKSDDLPALRKTPQMLAAGWGGSGLISHEIREELCESMSSKFISSALDVSMENDLSKIESRLSSAPSDLFSQHKIMDIEDLKQIQFNNFIDNLNEIQEGTFISPAIKSISGLVEKDIPIDTAEALTEIIDAGFDEHAVVVLFLYLLMQEEQIKKRLARSAKRIFTKAYKQLPGISDELQLQVKIAIEMYLQQYREDRWITIKPKA